jgi:hypothetical protein
MELIRMLDDPLTLEEDASTIIQILLVHFPTQESYEAIERYGKRIQEPTKRAKFKEIIEGFRANDPRKQ